MESRISCPPWELLRPGCGEVEAQEHRGSRGEPLPCVRRLSAEWMERHGYLSPGRDSLGLLPLVFSPSSFPLSSAAPSLAEISAGPLFSVPCSLGPLLPSHMLLHKLLCCPLLLFPPSPPSSLQCTHILPYRHTVPLSSPVPFPGPSGFQMRPAEHCSPPSPSPTQLTHPDCLRERSWRGLPGPSPSTSAASLCRFCPSSSRKSPLPLPQPPPPILSSPLGLGLRSTAWSGLPLPPPFP